MKELNQFISNFLSRAGSYVFISTVLSRLLSLLASWVALQLIPSSDLGIVIYAYQIILFIIPVAGFGLHQSLIRYGAQLKTIEEKNQLFNYVLKKGILVSLGLIGLIFIISYFINFEFNKTRFYLTLLSFSILTNFIFILISIQFRLHKKNKFFAFSNLTYNIILVVLVFLLSYYFNELGYAISLLITPLIVALLFVNKLGIKWNEKIKLTITNFSFWRYGFFASLSNVTTQLLISIDILLIGYILKDLELVTIFKYVSLIPYSLLFLSQVVITTDFVNFTEKINDKKYIKTYIQNYIKLLSFISLICISVIYLFGTKILTIFGEEYASYHSTLIVMTFGICGILIIRGLFGNLLSSIGKAHINFIITSIALVLNIGLNYYLIPIYGILGAAITSAILMWFTGFLCFLFFYYYYKTTKAF